MFKSEFKSKECYKSECTTKEKDGFLNWDLEWYWDCSWSGDGSGD